MKKIILLLSASPLISNSAVFIEYRTLSDMYKTLHSQRIADGQGQIKIDLKGSNIFKSCYASADVNPIIGQLTCTSHDGLNIEYSCYGEEVAEVHFTKSKIVSNGNDSVSLSLRCKQ